MDTYFISTSIPYVNARPHLGHALEFVQADAVARFWRARGRTVFFLTGTDENAMKNVQAAEEKGMRVADFVAENSRAFIELTHALHISNDDFIRTSVEARHKEGAQKLWRSLNPEDVYKKRYAGFYCLGCESFKTEKELTEKKCPEHPFIELERVEEENYFFRLSRYQKPLEDLIVSNRLHIVPDTKKNETLAFIREGLEDLSISRSSARTKQWGIPVPGDAEQYMYVWVDALSNYINALGYGTGDKKFEDYWTHAREALHVIGKGINRFHTVYWPAFLLSAGVRTPTRVFVHGYITINGQKMSKSLGNVADPFAIVKQYGADAVRYYLLREISAYEDGDWSDGRFRERYTADLANGLGNFVSRVAALAEKLGECKAHAPAPEVIAKIEETKKTVAAKMEELRFNEAIAAIGDCVAFGDRYVNEKKPWATQDKKAILDAVIMVDNLGALLAPFLPETAEKITKSIQWLSPNVMKVERPPILFPRL
ncbi:methionine--tRNA ligase [candidate division WWE3 bacterium RIFCSPLOWO2_02_FULL_53_10]|uniref:Methionine--tRNA ligase n=1 Tax=candidate division WWE3 bacterium RIFCSPLOWO2_02_FULL_53_10 TaxID=1802629 RepID=A0A1F4WPR3_UNCKA|nr:MAG: methionine--tRNA ligase [candidate division WWE3 bacterium RIFCSPLOWO2_02_FULL_53_10]